MEFTSRYDGNIWHVPVFDLEEAVVRGLSDGGYEVLLDVRGYRLSFVTGDRDYTLVGGLYAEGSPEDVLRAEAIVRKAEDAFEAEIRDMEELVGVPFEYWGKEDEYMCRMEEGLL